MNRIARVNDAAVASGLAFVTGELEKLDSELRKPLGQVSYARDVEIISGDGGWYETLSSYNVDYSISGGVGNLFGGVQNAIARIQANLSKDSIKTTLFQSTMSIKWVDMQMQRITGRNIADLLEEGTRLVYDRYLDRAVYKGFPEKGITGLVNSSEITAATVAYNAANTSTNWADKTPEEIMKDVNAAIEDAWKAAEYDDRAVPNHILIDPSNYNRLNGTVMTVSGTPGDSSILSYLKRNNLAAALGTELNIYPCRHCAGAGTGSSERMIVYRNEKRFVDFPLPVDLTRAMTGFNYNDWSIDTLFASLVGQVRIHYTQPFVYRDGI